MADDKTTHIITAKHPDKKECAFHPEFVKELRRVSEAGTTKADNTKNCMTDKEHKEWWDLLGG